MDFNVRGKRRFDLNDPNPALHQKRGSVGSRAIQKLGLLASLLMMSPVFAGTYISGLSLTVAADDSVTVNNTGNSEFSNDSVGTAGDYPYINGWGWASGTITWNDTNNTPTLRLDDSGMDVLNAGGIANANGNKSGSVQLTGDTTLGAALRAAYGPGVNAFTSTIAMGSVPFVVTGTVDIAPIAVDLDLSVSKDDGVTEAVPGTQVVYTIVAANAGPGDEADALIGDAFPAGLTCNYTSVAAGGATGNTASGSGNIQDNVAMPSGSSITYTATCDIDSSATGTIDNSVTILTNNNDTDPNNNTATDVDTLTPEADLSITKTDNDFEVVAGGAPFDYTIEVTNAGPSDADNVVVTDTLPAGLTFVSTTGCAEDPNGAPTCSLGTIAAGGSASYTLSVSADADVVDGAVLTNSAVTASDSTDPDDANNTATEDTTVIRVSDIVADYKLDDPDPVVAGAQLTYTIGVSNQGPSDAWGRPMCPIRTPVLRPRPER